MIYTQAVYDYLAAYIDNNGYAPLVREIAAGVGCSTSTVYNTLRALQAQGRIERKPHTIRGIKKRPPERSNR